MSDRATGAVALTIVILLALGNSQQFSQGGPSTNTPNNSSMHPEHHGVPRLASLPTNFSIFWITDSQFLSDSNEGLFAATTTWIANHWTQYHGKVVVHTGDIVETPYAQGQYENASRAMSILLNERIPYTWDAGNHDDLTTDPPSWLGGLVPAFNTTLVQGVVDSTSYAHWAGSYDKGMDTAISFTANGLGFLIVNLEWNANPRALSWAGDLLSDPTYATDYVIIATHAYIDSLGLTNDGRWGSTLLNFTTALTSLMDAHYPRVILTMNGHFGADAGYHTTTPVNGRNQLLFNRQDCTDIFPCEKTNSSTPDRAKVGASTVTILTFNTANNQIDVRSFDVFQGQYRQNPNDQYTLPNILPDFQIPKIGPSNATSSTRTVTVLVTTTFNSAGDWSNLPVWTYAAIAALFIAAFSIGFTIKSPRAREPKPI